MKERITGSSKKPFDSPKRMMPNHRRKKTTNMYVLEGESVTMARNVEKPPWNTLDPILLSACYAL